MRSNSIKAENVTPINLKQAAEICRVCLETERMEGVRVTPFFLGAPGQGKTAIVEQFVESLNAEILSKREELIKAGTHIDDAIKQTGPLWKCLSYRLAQCDPTDLKGVPVYEKVNEREMCSFAPPKNFPMVGIPDSADGYNVAIFLDELPQANPTIQNLAANIIDGKVGDYVLDPARTFIICAGNRKQDHAATYEVPRNVGNRLIKHEVRTLFLEWEEWAMENGLNPMVIGYLKDKQQFFNEPPPEEGYVYGTPRSWHKLSCQMNYLGEKWFDENGVGFYMAQGTVGMASAIAFHQFAKSVRNNYSIDAIMAGEKVAPPKEDQRDILFSLVLEATYRINSWVEEAIGNGKYSTIPINNDTARHNMLVELLGKEKIKGIENMYLWLDQKGIDPAFQVLINKYQSPATRNHLRSCIMLHSVFAKTAVVYEKIHQAVIIKR